MSSRFFAAAIVTVFSLTACQGTSPTTPGAQAAAPAAGQGVIKGRITTAGVVAVSEGHYRTILQAGASVPGAHITISGGRGGAGSQGSSGLAVGGNGGNAGAAGSVGSFDGNGGRGGSGGSGSTTVGDGGAAGTLNGGVGGAGGQGGSGTTVVGNGGTAGSGGMLIGNGGQGSSGTALGGNGGTAGSGGMLIGNGGQGGHGGMFVSETTSGADGSFSITVPAGVAYTITASHPDGRGGTMKQVAIVEVPLAAEPPIVDVASLVTRRTGSIQGVIALSDGSDPEGADVFVPGTTMAGKVSAKGRFALANLPEGTWNLVVQKPGYQRAGLANLSVQAGRPLVLTEAVTLTKGEADGGGLKALIRDNAGRAVVGASFTATSEAGTAYTAVSDGQGNVSLTGLPAGNYRTQVYRSFYQVPAPGSLTVATGETADAGTVTLNSTVMHFGKISGQLIDETGEPVDGAIVQLDPPTTEQVFTDARGNFTLDRVMPGEYTLRASAGGFEVNERTILVDNRPGFVAQFDEGFVLRQPFDPARPKPAGRAAATLLPPNAKLTKQGNDLMLQWEPVGLPPNVKAVAYEIEAEVAPNFFMPITTTTETTFKLPGFANITGAFRVTARPAEAPAAYRVTQVDLADSIAKSLLEQAKAQREAALDSRKTARELAQLELMNQATTLHNAAQALQQGAITQLMTSVVQSAVSMSASQVSIKQSVKAPATALASKTKLQQVNGDKLAIKAGIGKVPPAEKQAELAKFQQKSKEAEAEAKKLEAEAQVAMQQAAIAAELQQRMNQMMQAIIKFLQELQEAENEQMRALIKV